MHPNPHSVSSHSERRVNAFRGRRSRLPLRTVEAWLLAILGLHLCFLPWALGTMHPWGQAISLLLAVTGFVMALWPHEYNENLAGGNDFLGSVNGRRLLRFPIFWIGLAILAYVVLQAVNPSWRFAQSTTRWWLVRLQDVSWLPAGVDAPFARFNAWRQVMIYAAAWLSVCSIWIGLSRRLSLRILLWVVSGNALVLGGLLAVQRITGDRRIPWPLNDWTDQPLFASFIYHNHAGAYLALAAFCPIALAVWFFDHGRRSLAKSTPAGVLAFLALFQVGSIFFTLSRGAVLTFTMAVVVLCIWLLVRQRVQPKVPGTNPIIRSAIVAMFLVFIAVAFRYVDFTEIYGRWDSMATQGANDASVRSRVLVRNAAIDMMEAHGLRGVGAGGFRYLFPEYLKYYPEIYKGGNLYWEHAHCDWLEIPVELGLAGDLLVLCGAGWWIAVFVRRRALWSALAVPLILGCLQTVVHAGFDFPFQCPAIMVTWCMMIAIAGRWVELELIGTSRAEG
jgi:hypothetical protein